MHSFKCYSKPYISFDGNNWSTVTDCQCPGCEPSQSREDHYNSQWQEVSNPWYWSNQQHQQYQPQQQYPTRREYEEQLKKWEERNQRSNPWSHHTQNQPQPQKIHVKHERKHGKKHKKQKPSSFQQSPHQQSSSCGCPCICNQCNCNTNTTLPTNTYNYVHDAITQCLSLCNDDVTKNTRLAHGICEYFDITNPNQPKDMFKNVSQKINTPESKSVDNSSNTLISVLEEVLQAHMSNYLGTNKIPIDIKECAHVFANTSAVSNITLKDFLEKYGISLVTNDNYVFLNKPLKDVLNSCFPKNTPKTSQESDAQIERLSSNIMSALGHFYGIPSTQTTQTTQNTQTKVSTSDQHILDSMLNTSQTTAPIGQPKNDTKPTSSVEVKTEVKLEPSATSELTSTFLNIFEQALDNPTGLQSVDLPNKFVEAVEQSIAKSNVTPNENFRQGLNIFKKLLQPQTKATTTATPPTSIPVTVEQQADKVLDDYITRTSSIIDSINEQSD